MVSVIGLFFKTKLSLLIFLSVSSNDLTFQVIIIRMSDRKFEQMTGTDSTTSLLQELIGQMLLQMHTVVQVFHNRLDP